VILSFILFRFKFEIIQDQLYRAFELEPDDNSSKRVMLVRQRFHKMYYHFKPEKYYWIMWIVFRKAIIALIALMFRGNPSFQLSCTVLVLFSSYVMQVKHKPFMSSVERSQVVGKHKDAMEKLKEKQALPDFVPTRIEARMLVIDSYITSALQRKTSSNSRKQLKTIKGFQC